MTRPNISTIPHHRNIAQDLIVRHLMRRSLVSGSVGGIYSILIPNAYASLAIAVTAWNVAGYILRAALRPVHALIALNSQGLKAKISQDLAQAKNRLVFIASVLTCIFYHLFLPHKFCFKLPPNVRPRPVQKPAQKKEKPTEALLRLLSAFAAQDEQRSQPFAICNGQQESTVIGPQSLTGDGMVALDLHDEAVRALVTQCIALNILPRNLTMNGLLVLNLRGLAASLPALQLSKPVSLGILPPEDFTIRDDGEEDEMSMSNSYIFVEPMPADQMKQELLQAGAEPESLFVWASNTVDRVFGRHAHHSKDQKYAHFFREMLDHCHAFPDRLHQILSGPLRSDDIRVQYQAFVYALRELAAEGNQRALQASYHRFASVRLFSYLRSLVELICGPISKDGLSLATFADVFNQNNDKLDEIPANIGISIIDRICKNLSGWMNVAFDPGAGSNMPHVRAHLDITGQPVRLLRHSTPVQQTLRAAITADYVGFITSAHKKNERILHIILEKATPGKTSTLGDESTRVEARMELQAHENFFPLAFPMDGSFFHPKVLTIHTFDALAAALSEEILKKKSLYFRIPDKLRQDAVFTSAVPELCREARAIFFHGKDRIYSLQDHQTYLLIAYAHITFFLMRHLKVSFVELPCKDYLDRGGTMTTIFELYYLIVAGKENDADALYSAMINTLGPSPMVKKQGIIASRKVFIDYATGVFNAMQQAQKDQLRALWNLHTGDQPYVVHEVTGQSVYPVGSTVRTRKDYDVFLRNCFQTAPIAIRPLKKDLVQDMSAGKSFRKQGKLDAESIIAQIDKDLPRYPTFLGNSKEATQSSAQMLDYLHAGGIEEEEALSVLCCFQQGISADIFGQLKLIFDNEALQINVIQDSEDDPDFERLFTINVKAGVATLQFIFLGKIIEVSTKKTLGKIAASTIISDHRTGAHKFLWFARE